MWISGSGFPIWMSYSPDLSYFLFILFILFRIHPIHPISYSSYLSHFLFILFILCRIHPIYHISFRLSIGGKVYTHNWLRFVYIVEWTLTNKTNTGVTQWNSANSSNTFQWGGLPRRCSTAPFKMVLYFKPRTVIQINKSPQIPLLGPRK